MLAKQGTRFIVKALHPSASEFDNGRDEALSAGVR